MFKKEFKPEFLKQKNILGLKTIVFFVIIWKKAINFNITFKNYNQTLLYIHQNHSFS